jgi:hypothetical protein
MIDVNGSLADKFYSSHHGKQREEFRDLLQTMSSSLETARTSLQTIKEKQQNLDMTMASLFFH